MTRNRDVALLLYELAQLLEVQGVAFKPRAYQRAAQAVEALSEDVADLAAQGRLGEIPGVGQSIQKKIREFLETGRVATLERLRGELPAGVLELMALDNVGPKSAKRLYDELGVQGLDALEMAARAGKVRALAGFGAKSETEILAAIERLRRRPKRAPYHVAEMVADELVAALRQAVPGLDVVPAGSLRRGRDTVGDLDLLATATGEAAAQAAEAFARLSHVQRVIEQGATRVRVQLNMGLQVDLRIVPPESRGAALLYFTGSKEHNIELRKRALKRGWTINEYALTRKEDGGVIAGPDEEEIYRRLDLAYVPPELRENQGEIEQAARGDLPRLVEAADLQGDLHTHTRDSDGRVPARRMLEEASQLGLRWYGVSDHAKGAGIVQGLDGAGFRSQRRRLDALRDAFPHMDILHGAEVNIRKDGRLELDADARAGLDYVIASIHGQFRLPVEEQTRRILRAFEDGADILGHPSTRQIGTRDEIDVEWERVYQAAADQGVVLEVNATPFRLDLAGERVRQAATYRVDFALDTDAHSPNGLRDVRYGLLQARRGTLEKSRVITTWTAAQVRKRLGRSRRA